MLEQKRGTILMISSMAGVYGFGGEADAWPRSPQVGLAKRFTGDCDLTASRSA